MEPLDNLTAVPMFIVPNYNLSLESANTGVNLQTYCQEMVPESSNQEITQWRVQPSLLQPYVKQEENAENIDNDFESPQETFEDVKPDSNVLIYSMQDIKSPSQPEVSNLCSDEGRGLDKSPMDIVPEEAIMHHSGRTRLRNNLGTLSKSPCLLSEVTTLKTCGYMRVQCRRQKGQQELTRKRLKVSVYLENLNNLFSVKVLNKAQKGETIFICSVCGKGFTIRKQLSSHRCVHRGEKPPKPSVQKITSTHSRVHRGEKPPKPSVQKVISSKLHSCLFCKKLFTKVSRHMDNCHSGEAEVAAVLNMEKGSKDRKIAWQKLVKRGDFYHNNNVMKEGSGLLLTAYRMGKRQIGSEFENYLPCEYCLGMYKRHELWKHQKLCVFKFGGKNTKGAPQARGRLLLTSLQQTSYGAPKVFKTMADNEVTQLARLDPLVVKFAEDQCKKYEGKKHLRYVITQKLRGLGRLLQAARRAGNTMSLSTLLEPAHFDTMISFVREIAGFDPLKLRFKAPSLAVSLGNTLKNCNNIKLIDAIKESSKTRELLARNYADLHANYFKHIYDQSKEHVRGGKVKATGQVVPVKDLTTLNKCPAEQGAKGPDSMVNGESQPPVTPSLVNQDKCTGSESGNHYPGLVDNMLLDCEDSESWQTGVRCDYKSSPSSSLITSPVTVGQVLNDDEGTECWPLPTSPVPPDDVHSADKNSVSMPYTQTPASTFTYEDPKYKPFKTAPVTEIYRQNKDHNVVSVPSSLVLTSTACIATKNTNNTRPKDRLNSTNTQTQFLSDSEVASRKECDELQVKHKQTKSPAGGITVDDSSRRVPTQPTISIQKTDSSKLHCCMFCGKLLAKVPRHMVTCHSNETAVATALKMPTGSKERKAAWLKLVKQGDFGHNKEVMKTGNGVLLTAYRMGTRVRYKGVHDYLPCEYCLGTYRRHFLWKHQQVCVATGGSVKTSRSAAHTRGHLPLPAPQEAGHGASDFDSMKDRRITKLAKLDPLVAKYAEVLCKNKGENYSRSIIFQKMKHLGRLLEVARAAGNRMSLSTLLEPRHFNTLIGFVREIVGYDTARQQYISPSLALSFGMTLKTCNDIVLTDSIKEGKKTRENMARDYVELHDNEFKLVTGKGQGNVYGRKLKATLHWPQDQNIERLENNLNEGPVRYQEISTKVALTSHATNVHQDMDCITIQHNHSTARPQEIAQLVPAISATVTQKDMQNNVSGHLPPFKVTTEHRPSYEEDTTVSPTETGLHTDQNDSEPGPMADQNDSEPGPMADQNDSEPGPMADQNDSEPGPMAKPVRCVKDEPQERNLAACHHLSVSVAIEPEPSYEGGTEGLVSLSTATAQLTPIRQSHHYHSQHQRKSSHKDCHSGEESIDQDILCIPVAAHSLADSKEVPNYRYCVKEKQTKTSTARSTVLVLDQVDIQPKTSTGGSTLFGPDPVQPKISMQSMNCSKLHCCIFCDKLIAKVPRHMEQCHQHQDEVVTILDMPKGSKQRKVAWQKLVKLGDFSHNKNVIKDGNGVLICAYRMGKRQRHHQINDYVSCQYCLGTYRRQVPRKHQQLCVLKHGQSSIGKTAAIHPACLVDVVSVRGDIVGNEYHAQRTKPSRIEAATEDRSYKELTIHGSLDGFGRKGEAEKYGDAYSMNQADPSCNPSQIAGSPGEIAGSPGEIAGSPGEIAGRKIDDPCSQDGEDVTAETDKYVQTRIKRRSRARFTKNPLSKEQKRQISAFIENSMTFKALKVPGKVECLNCIKECKLVGVKDWRKIKFFVYNKIQSMSRL